MLIIALLIVEYCYAVLQYCLCPLLSIVRYCSYYCLFFVVIVHCLLLLSRFIVYCYCWLYIVIVVVFCLLYCLLFVALFIFFVLFIVLWSANIVSIVTILFVLFVLFGLGKFSDVTAEILLKINNTASRYEKLYQ